MIRPRFLRRLFPFLTLVLLLLCANSAMAQTFVPITSGFATDLKIWTSGGNTFVKVRLTFSDTGHRVSNWGQVTRSGDEFVADAKVERWTGGSGQAITFAENTYVLGSLPQGTYKFTFKSYGTPVKSEQFDPSLVVERWEPTTLPSDRVYAAIWTTESITFTRVNFVFPDSGYSVIDWGHVTRNGNDFAIDTKVERWTGESRAQTNIVDRTFELGALAPGSYTLMIKMYGMTVRTQPFSIAPGSTRAPKLLTESNSERAIAVDSVTWLSQFPLETSHNFSPDRRARILLFATDMDASTLDGSSGLIAYAEDPAHRSYPLTIEHVGTVPGFDWLTQIIVRPPDELNAGGEIGVVLSLRGMTSNRVLLNIKPSATGPQ